jgi:NAD(P)-dependent dehydrogenase (short-subunit alcohol dehydrogenase family)
VTANAVAPGALTRLTEDLGLSDAMVERFGPEWVVPVVTWLASPDSAVVTGQVIESSGHILGIAEGWRRGPHVVDPPTEPADVGAVVRDLLAKAAPRTKMSDVF